MLLVVETQHRSLHTFCNDREWGDPWPRNGRLHIQDMRLTSARRERQVQELHQEEPTPVADVARSGSYSEPRKLRLPLKFFQIPNHSRKCQERCRRFLFHIILFLSPFTVYMYLRGGRGGRLGCKYIIGSAEALPILCVRYFW